jgi:Cu(I)/Ag(I) efflux system membrane protein CusA/SilA
MPTTDTDGSERGAIARVIDFSAKRRAFVLLIAALLTAWGLWSGKHSQLDALPDLSDTQVIVATEWMGRSPTLIESQVTYPIVTTMLGAPKVKTVRGFTMFGMSFVYAIFDDGTDIYWARSRVLELLAKARDKLPEGVTPTLGPDATSVGWVFQYALVDDSGKHDLQQLRAIQDWSLRYWLQSVEGVAEVASVGGFEKEYQIEIDPQRMKARAVSIAQIAAAVRGSNAEVGGRVIEMSEHDYALRGRGLVKSREDLAWAVITSDEHGVPIRIGDVADVTVGGALRRGLVDLDGRGETVGGIVVMRHGENALAVIDRVKAKLAEVNSALPAGVTVVPVYDRSRLINDSVATLTSNLLLILGVVIAVIFVFLFHFKSALVAAIALPVATAATFIAFYYLKLSLNIMSLAGIILALGDMVDSACVLIENAHKRIEAAERAGEQVSRADVVLAAARDLGGSMFGALLVLTVAFLPVFALEGEEGRLFRPLALAKTLSMAIALPARPLARHRAGAGFDRGHRLPLHAARLGVHATALRRGLAVHADHRTRHVDRRSQASPPADGRGDSCHPGGRAGLRQSGPSQYFARSRAAVDVRDGGAPEAALAMAQRPAAQPAHRRARSRHLVARDARRLDHAHQGAHRHAGDWHSHPHRREGLRQRPRDHRQRHRRSRARARFGSAYAQRVR